MLGRIIGKATTTRFTFELRDGADVRKFEYLKVPHRVYEWVLCQVVEIEKSHEQTLAQCHVLGYKEKGKVKQIRIPFDIGTEVFLADDDFIKEVIQLDGEGAYLGVLDGKQIPVRLDLNKILTKHVAVLAKSGAGKSYAVGVLAEEILERTVPLLIIDPHGEYGSLAEPTKESTERLARFHVTPKKYVVREYGSPEDSRLLPLRLSNNLTQQELLHLLPGKLNNTQLGILYSALKNVREITFESILLSLEQEESNAKWSVINLIEHVRGMGIFSNTPLAYNELVKSGVASVINMRGIPPELQQIIVYKLAKDLFELRKKNHVPPFFLIVEEAHNYCPERSFGEATSSRILRTIASEGRKFGLGLCVVSQRPARVDKSVLSQCTTQMILKVTNPSDLKAIGASVEGLTAESEAEIQNLPVGTALVTGVVEMPLFVNIRPRRTQHGGHAVNILAASEDATFLDQARRFQEEALLPLVKPSITAKDVALMHDGKVRTILVPAYRFTCQEKEEQYFLIVDMTNGEIVVDLDEYTTRKLPALEHLSQREIRLLMDVQKARSFSAKEGAGVEDALRSLVEKGYLEEDAPGTYRVTERYVLTRLSNHAQYAPVTYETITFDEQQKALVTLDEVKRSLNTFTKVLDQQECWIVQYVSGDV